MILYEDSDLQVELSDQGSSSCVVTFTSLNEHEKGFGQKFFDDASVSGIYFIARWNHWWQTEGCAKAVAAAAEALGRLAPHMTMTYGSSMGAFGAALYSQRLRADRVLMLAPQFSTDPAKPPYETRWAREAKRITFIDDDMAGSISPESQKFIVYDPREDAHQSNLFALVPNTTLLPIPFGGHNVSHFLQQSELLMPLVRQALGGSLEARSFRKQVRASRAMAGNYWHRLGLRLKPKRLNLALDCLRRAVTLRPRDAAIMLDLGTALVAAKRLVEAVPILRNAAQLAPDAPAPLRALSVAERLRGNNAESVDLAERALTRRPDSTDLQRVLVLALIASGQLQRAERMLDEMDDKNPDQKSDNVQVRNKLHNAKVERMEKFKISPES